MNPSFPSNNSFTCDLGSFVWFYSVHVSSFLFSLPLVDHCDILKCEVGKGISSGKENKGELFLLRYPGSRGSAEAERALGDPRRRSVRRNRHPGPSPSAPPLSGGPDDPAEVAVHEDEWPEKWAPVWGNTHTHRDMNYYHFC